MSAAVIAAASRLRVSALRSAASLGTGVRELQNVDCRLLRCHDRRVRGDGDGDDECPLSSPPSIISGFQAVVAIGTPVIPVIAVAGTSVVVI